VEIAAVSAADIFTRASLGLLPELEVTEGTVVETKQAGAGMLSGLLPDLEWCPGSKRAIFG
jgi:hypothetical protein